MQGEKEKRAGREAVHFPGIVQALRTCESHRMTPGDLRTGDVLAQIPNPIELRAYLEYKLFAALKDSEVSHVMMILRPRGRTRFLDIVAKGMRYRRFKPRDGSIYIVLRPELTEQQERDLVAEARRVIRANPGYSSIEHLTAYIPFVIAKLLPFLARRARNIVNERRSYFCSELIDSVYKKAGVPLTPRDRDSNTVLTTDIVRSSALRFRGLVYNDSPATKEVLLRVAQHPQV